MASHGNTDATAADLAVWAEALHHGDNAARQVAYRKKKKAEVALLKQTIDDLEAAKKQAQAVKASKQKGMLSWKDVAKALMDDRKLTESQQKSLIAELKRHRGVAREMHEWVCAQVSLERPLNAICATWRNVSLLASPESRKMGKEWITKQMYHNRDRIFHQYGFPSFDSSELLDRDVSFDFQDTGYTCISRLQVQNPWSFDDHIAFFRATLLPIQCTIYQYTPDTPMVVNEVEGNTMQCAVVTRSNEFANDLVGEFHSADEYTMVIQQIQIDDTCDHARHKRQRNRMYWNVMRRMPGGGVKIRVLMVISQLFTIADGPVPLEEDADEWGISLDGCPDHLKEARYPRLWKTVVDGQLERHRGNYIRQLMESREDIRAIEATRLSRSNPK